jgi:hypothetical protein
MRLLLLFLLNLVLLYNAYCDVLNTPQSNTSIQSDSLTSAQSNVLNTQSSILYIGDSHTVGFFGQILDKNLREILEFKNLTTIGACGSRPISWYKNSKTSCGYFEHKKENKIKLTKNYKIPNLLHLLNELKPEVVIVELGPNLWSDFINENEIKTNHENLKKELQKIVLDIKKTSAKCIWIGQPDSRTKSPKARLKAFSDFIENEVSSYCHYINSLKFTKYPDQSGDGYHYTGKTGFKLSCIWAKEVLKEIVKILKIDLNESQSLKLENQCL